MDSKYIEKLKEKLICADCIREDFLHDLVERESDEGQCYYCGGTGSVISLEDMAEHIETAFETFYRRTVSEPDDLQYLMHKDKDSDYVWERSGESTAYAIMDAAEIPKEAAGDIQAILAAKYFDFDEAAMGVEEEFSSEARYEKVMSPGVGNAGWSHFEKTIKFEARFFSRTAAAQLSNLFDTIDEMRTQQGHPIVVSAGPDTNLTHLYRARVFQSEDKLKQAMERPDKELGAPPSHFASAGRMNARGISVFYGATSVSTACAEVRPPVGSSVAVARFEIIRTIRLLDLSALREVHETGSIFDPGYAYRLGRSGFFNN